MKLRWPLWCVCISLLSAPFALLACSSSSSEDDEETTSETESTNTTVTVDGVFSGTRSNTNGSANVGFSFNQSGSMLTGSYNDGSLGNGVISGNIDGDDLEFSTVMTSGSIVIEWVGQAAEDGSSMSGTWAVAVGGDANGTWSAAR